jgi:hypothetical protein
MSFANSQIGLEVIEDRQALRLELGGGNLLHAER